MRLRSPRGSSAATREGVVKSCTEKPKGEASRVPTPPAY